MATTIQVSDELQKTLSSRKIFDRETYEEIIWDLIEDSKEINEQTKRELEAARADVKKGNFHTLEQVKKDLGF